VSKHLISEALFIANISENVANNNIFEAEGRWRAFISIRLAAWNRVCEVYSRRPQSNVIEAIRGNDAPAAIIQCISTALTARGGWRRVGGYDLLCISPARAGGVALANDGRASAKCGISQPDTTKPCQIRPWRLAGEMGVNANRLRNLTSPSMLIGMALSVREAEIKKHRVWQAAGKIRAAMQRCRRDSTISNLLNEAKLSGPKWRRKSSAASSVMKRREKRCATSIMSNQNVKYCR